MSLKIDVANMMSSVVGDPHGVTEADLAWLRLEAARVHGNLEQDRRSGGLAFMDLPGRHEDAARVRDLAGSLRGRFRNLVVLGIGGSALGTIAVHSALNPLLHNLLPDEARAGHPRLFVLDNIDPDWIGEFLDALDPEETLFNVISKSGGTAETVAQFLVFREALKDRLGVGHGVHLVITTDREKGPLRGICREEGIASLEVPDGVGGRFSVLTAVGLFPLAMTGVDIESLLRGAGEMAARCSAARIEDNPAYMHGGMLFLLDLKKGKRIHVLMPYAQSLRDLADWFRQLWAESLGKKHSVDGDVVHVGPTPVRALGVTDQHSQLQLYAEGPNDKAITFLRVESFAREIPIPEAYPEIEGIGYLGGHTLNELIAAEQSGTMVALTEQRRPNSTITFPAVDPASVGEFLMLMEVQTAFAGGLYRVNVFDQPGVEASKVAAHALLGRQG